MGKMFSKEEYMAKREVLRDVVPLPLPFQMIFLVSSVCNFKCNYCIQSKFSESPILHSNKFMDLDDYKCAVDNISDYIRGIGTSRRIKRFSISGLGETLVHKDLPEMVAYAKQADIANEIKVFTNGSLLTHNLSDKLIAAGLDLLAVSLQGVNAVSYKETADYTVDFDTFVDNIRYFYEHRGNCKVYCKVADTVLRDEGEELDLARIFLPISDEVNIEHIANGNGVLGNADTFKFHSVMTNEFSDFKTCYMPFVIAEVLPRGDIYACARYEGNGFSTPSIGNIFKVPFGNMWNKGVHKQMCVNNLEHKMMGDCIGCQYWNEMCTEHDNIDGYEDKIIARFDAV